MKWPLPLCPRGPTGTRLQDSPGHRHSGVFKTPQKNQGPKGQEKGLPLLSSSQKARRLKWLEA